MAREATRGQELLRGPGSSPHASFLVLFFDVVYVFALTRVSQRLIDDFTTERYVFVSEFGQTMLLFLALWFVWSLTTWATSRYDPDQPPIQAVLVLSMAASMVMAVSLPEAFDTRGLSFALGYVAVQVGRPAFLTWAVRAHPQRDIAFRILCWSTGSAVLWVGGALVAGEARGALWTTALLVDYGGARLGWPVPGLGAARASGWSIQGEHLAERYQQFTIIALGEVVLVTGLGFSRSDFAPARWTAFVLAFATTMLLWRIYFHRAGAVLVEAVARAPRPGRLGESATYTHLVMAVGVVLTGVGYELAITHPYGHTYPTCLIAVVGGPALFVVGRSRFEYEVFGRVSWPRLVGVLVLLLAVPVLVHQPPLVGAATTTTLLAVMAVVDSVRTWGHPSERPASPL